MVRRGGSEYPKSDPRRTMTSDQSAAGCDAAGTRSREVGNRKFLSRLDGTFRLHYGGPRQAAPTSVALAIAGHSADRYERQRTMEQSIAEVRLRTQESRSRDVASTSTRTRNEETQQKTSYLTRIEALAAELESRASARETETPGDVAAKALAFSAARLRSLISQVSTDDIWWTTARAATECDCTVDAVQYWCRESERLGLRVIQKPSREYLIHRDDALSRGEALLARRKRKNEAKQRLGGERAA